MKWENKDSRWHFNRIGFSRQRRLLFDQNQIVFWEKICPLLFLLKNHFSHISVIYFSSVITIIVSCYGLFSTRSSVLLFFVTFVQPLLLFSWIGSFSCQTFYPQVNKRSLIPCYFRSLCYWFLALCSRTVFCYLLSQNVSPNFLPRWTDQFEDHPSGNHNMT